MPLVGGHKAFAPPLLHCIAASGDSVASIGEKCDYQGSNSDLEGSWGLRPLTPWLVGFPMVISRYLSLPHMTAWLRFFLLATKPAYSMGSFRQGSRAEDWKLRGMNLHPNGLFFLLPQVRGIILPFLSAFNGFVWAVIRSARKPLPQHNFSSSSSYCGSPSAFPEAMLCIHLFGPGIFPSFLPSPSESQRCRAAHRQFLQTRLHSLGTTDERPCLLPCFLDLRIILSCSNTAGRLMNFDLNRWGR